MPPTVGSYRKGAAARPHIVHDNGHLDKFAPRAPTATDYAKYAAWSALMNGAESAQGIWPGAKGDLPDALAAYRHFMQGNGARRRISYERYVRNDDSGKKTLVNQIAEAQNAALNLYLAMGGIGDDYFDFTATTGLPAGNGGNVRFPYPATENWQKAIGAHNFWISGTLAATATPPQGFVGPPALSMVQFELELTIHVEDMYNFNPGAEDIATGLPDAMNGEFEVTGLAHQYINWDEITRTVSWTGDAVAGYSHSIGDVISGMRRQRGPQDARRARDRI